MGAGAHRRSASGPARGLLASLCAVPFVLAAPAPAHAADYELTQAMSGGAEASVAVRSLKELRFRHAVRQQADFSCGSAALATLLTFHYGRPTAEAAILNDMIEHGDRAKIASQGFSLLDLQQFLRRHGLRSGGFRLSVEKMAAIGVPGIVLVNHNGYNHFVVLAGIRDGRVLLTDPALGTRATDADTFRREWNGIVFVILSDADAAQRTFNEPEDWATQPQATWEQARAFFGLSHPSWHDPSVF